MIVTESPKAGQRVARREPAPCHLTGDKLVDATALRIYQGTPIETRQADRHGVWQRCVEIARTLLRGDDTPPPKQTADGWLNPAFESWDRARHPEKYAGLPSVGELRQMLRGVAQ